ncbi:MAG: cation:proton antiporter [Desulfovibrionaceae bacterium]
MMLGQAESLLLVAAAAAVLPLAANALRLPAVILEILFGVLIGKSFLHVRFSGDWLPFLAQLGFLLLMFQAGMELDFTMLRKQGPGRLVLHLAIFCATLGLAFASADMLGQGAFMALVLSTTSLGLVVPTLKETGTSRTPFGQSVIIAATFADFLTLLGITLFVLWWDNGFSAHMLRPLPFFVGFGLILRACRLWAWWNPDKARRLLGQEDSQELGVRFSLVLLFLFVALSELAHLEPVLGAFLGGATLSFVFRERFHLETKLSGIAYGFLIPIFFIHVGMGFDLGNVLGGGYVLLTLKLLVVAVAVKLLPALLLALTGAPPRSVMAAGMLLSSRLSLVIAAASIGLEHGFITPALKDAIVLLAIITCLAGPTAFRAIQAGGPPPRGPGNAPRNGAPPQ